jgi:hypothetical protein
MAYREVTVIETTEVLRQWLAGAKTKRIARRLGLDPKTVRRPVRAAEGVMITTGTFTRDALDAAQRAKGSVVLVDGQRLTDLMMEHGVGVSHKAIKVPKVDNAELWPFLRMTYPRGRSRLDPEVVPIGTRAFRSWLLLFGLVPVDYDDLTFHEIVPGTALGWLHRFTVARSRPCRVGSARPSSPRR